MAVCGITVTPEGKPVATAELEAMTSALATQTGSAYLRDCDPEMGLGVTSPVATTDLWKSARVAVACDADISNQRVIRARVKFLPSDASLANVFAELFLLDGPDFLKQLRGVFAIAIWDYQSKTLLLATDRFGVKPLCYSSSSTAIVFASQARGILATRRVEKVLNPTALVNYLNFTVVPGPLSAFKGISKLPPGSYLIWKEGTARTGQYWEMTYPEDARGTTEALATEMLERMAEAVNCSSSDVRVSGLGCFLSGGTDSSSVVGLLTRLKKSPVTSLSIGFNEERFNELQYASLAAKHFGSRHIVGRLGPDDAFNILPKIVDLYDEPFANSSVIPTYYCLRMAREHGIEVMLAGDGGDELFGGNERYRTQQIYELYKKIPALLRNYWINPVASCISNQAPGMAGKFRRYVDTSNTPNPDRYLRWAMLQFFSPEQILGPTMPFRNGHSDLLAVARAHYHAAPATDEMNRLLYIDVKMTL
jgi:asparagine synthase (glutamine-hydrolysing)